MKQFNHRLVVANSKKAPLISFLLFSFSAAILVGLVSWHLGSDMNWDLQNYHFYDGYLVTHGLEIKDSICTVQSYLELDVNSFCYYLISNFSPLHANLTIAICQSFSISAAWVLCYFLLEGEAFLHRIILSSVGAFLAIIGPVFWSEIGGAMGDSLIELPIIVALILATDGCIKNDPKRILASGFFVGIAAALKLTNLIFAFGLGGAIVFACLAELKLKQFFMQSGVLVIGFFIGFSVIYYRTGTVLFHAYGNPFFPYFTNIFHSSYINTVNLKDIRWSPEGFVGYLLLPFDLTIRGIASKYPNHLIGMEIQFRTIYLAVFEIIIPLYFILKAARVKFFKNTKLSFVFGFVACSTVVWAVISSYYRYFAVIETIAPPILLVLVFQFIRETKLKYFSLIISSLLVIAASLYSLPNTTWGRAPYTSSYFGISKKDFVSYQNALIISSDAPLGFIYPYFPPSDQIIGLPERIPGLTQKFQDSYLRPLHEFKKIYVAGLVNGDFPGLEAILEKQYNIQIDHAKCRNYVTDVSTVVLCPAKLVKLPQ